MNGRMVASLKSEGGDRTQRLFFLTYGMNALCIYFSYITDLPQLNNSNCNQQSILIDFDAK